MNYQEAYKKLEKYGQLHVLKYYDELGEEEREALLTQIEQTDFDVLSLCEKKETLNPRGKIEPIAVMQLPEIAKKKEEYTKAGLEAIRAGKVGAVLLAGGMGTRLGSDAPKGVYNIGLTKDVFIFQRLVENLMDVVHQAGAWIPLYVMTSDKNHEATVSFLKDKDYFGYGSGVRLYGEGIYGSKEQNVHLPQRQRRLVFIHDEMGRGGENAAGRCGVAQCVCRGQCAAAHSRSLLYRSHHSQRLRRGS